MKKINWALFIYFFIILVLTICTGINKYKQEGIKKENKIQINIQKTEKIDDVKRNGRFGSYDHALWRSPESTQTPQGQKYLQSGTYHGLTTFLSQTISVFSWSIDKSGNHIQTLYPLLTSIISVQDLYYTRSYMTQTVEQGGQQKSKKEKNTIKYTWIIL